MTLKLKLIRETELARWYENLSGTVRQWVPKSVCKNPVKLADIHEVQIDDWWLRQNPFEKPAPPQEELKL